MTPVFTGNVDANGKLRLDCPIAFRDAVKALADAKVEVIIRRRRKARSDRQNAYYWCVVVALLADHCGYTSDEMHEALKWKFLRMEAESILPTVRSTTSLSTVEFEAFVENVRTWAGADLGVNIPEPNEVDTR